jgi:hypothetical protein
MKSMRKHIFQNFQYFLYKKKHSKHVRVLTICNTQENIFWYIRKFVTFASKTGYFKHEIYISYNIKNSDLKINMLKKIINLFLFLFFFWKKEKKKGGLAGSLAQASDPAGHKRAQPSFVNGELLFKWIDSLEQYRHI